MLRSPELVSSCLACQVPLAGPLAVPARMFGIVRHVDNPNLCSRCGSHLAAGEIRPVALVVLELESRLRFGNVELQQLSDREVPALLDQLQRRLEDQGGLVLPRDHHHPLRLNCYFNAPVAVAQPELQALRSLQQVVDWLAQELTRLGLNQAWKAVLTSGFVEIVACDGPLESFPMGEVSFRAAEMLQRASFGQLVCDGASLRALEQQDPQVLSSLASSVSQDSLRDPRSIHVLPLSEFITADGAFETSAGQQLRPSVSTFAQLSSLVLALIAAPCAAMVVLAPGAVFIGLGSAFAVLLPFWKAVGMSVWPRVLITLLAVLVSSLNWVRAELGQSRFRQLQRQVGGQLRLPDVQRRRLRLIRFSSAFVLSMVLLEGLLRVLVMGMPLL